MGVPDITLKKYFSDKARLADIFNYYCFDGEEAIQPDEVTLRDSDESIAITNDEDVYEVVERIRDILAVAEKNGTMFVLLGVENQEYIHYGMPVRNMIYDALTYTRQMEEKIKINREEKKLNSKNFFSGIRKGEKLIPVVTLVLYLGKEPWDGPRQLSDMLDMDQVPEKMRRYVQSQYQLNLLELRKINDYDRFRTDIKKVLALTACGNDKTQMMKLIEEDKGYRNLSNDAADAIVAMTSSEELKGVINKYDDMKGGLICVRQSKI